MALRLMWRVASGLALVGALGLSGCGVLPANPMDAALQTEAEVQARLGPPGRVWAALPAVPPGSKTLEYSRQPSGHTAYMVDIGADGKVLAVRQVLNRQSFARVVMGMAPEDVLRLLGRPMQITPYSLSGLTYYEWRYLDGPTRENSAIFFAIFDKSMRVVSTGSVRDPDLDVHPDPRIGLFGRFGFSGHGWHNDHFGHNGRNWYGGHSSQSIPRLHRGNPATMHRFSH